jgi:hypothetical protein
LRSPVLPKRLIIHVRGPGNLIIFRGEERIATLLNGKLQGTDFTSSKQAGSGSVRKNLPGGQSMNALRITRPEQR